MGRNTREGAINRSVRQERGGEQPQKDESDFG